MLNVPEALDAILQEAEALHDAQPDPTKRKLWWEVIQAIQERMRRVIEEETA